jgi:non-ribosomal peptide synthetase component F
MIEHQMSMTAANMFWLDILHDCNLDRPLPLPYDRYRLLDEHRTGRGTSVSFDFGEDLSHHFLAYSSSNNITPEQLALACYYVFLFKLTNGERDLCIGMNIDGRYKEELMSVIGIFVNAIPLRCQLDPHWSFHQLLKHVQEIITNSLEYSYFPLQRILAHHPNVSKPAFLDTSFVFVSTRNENTDKKVMIGDGQLQIMSTSIKISENEIMSKFDFALTFQHNLSTNQLSYTIDASLDLFNDSTVNSIAQRLHSMLEQLFLFNNDIMKKSIYDLSLVLPNERLLIQSVNNTEMAYSSVSCIHHEFVRQSMKYPQKLAVELDDQSLTYTELLYYIQLLSSNLLRKYGVIPGEVICQCMERSLSMVSCRRKYLFSF